MTALYTTIGYFTAIVVCLLVILGFLWFGLYLIREILKVLGYWGMTFKALVIVAKQRREKGENGSE